VLVAANRFCRFQIGQAGQAGAGKYAADRALRNSQGQRDTGVCQRFRRSFTICSALIGSMARGEEAGRGGSVRQACLTECQITPKPLASRGSGDTLLFGCLGSTKPSNGHVLNHFKATGQGQSGILMNVHLVEFLE
jgi:hypothetical protein